MTGTLVALPTNSDDTTWNPEERALVEAAGLVHVDAQSGRKTLAERPVVAAFLQHCARTGLDPIARQIYSIARKSKGQLKWQIQISIDGARLVAERSGQYEGQTTPEFTADGITWTQVWLGDEPPKAARVGVFRRGFREALYAVALWDAYVQTKDEWVDGRKTGRVIVSDMWQKMGPLMLAKCAEMLALRKAFPQDLSGLYSSEEMSQADAAAQAPVERPAASSAPDGAGRSDAAADGTTGPVESAPAVDPRRRAPKDPSWLAKINAAIGYEQLKPIYAEIEAAQDLDVLLTVNGVEMELGAFLWARRDELLNPKPAEDIVDAEVVEEGDAWSPTGTPPGEPVTEWPTAQIPNGEDV